MIKHAREHLSELAKRIRGSPTMHHVTHACQGAAHAIYFGAVFMEGHGLYGVMGGVLLFILAISYITGAGDVG